MPKAKTQSKIVYPAGVKEISEELGTDELIRRLKACARAFQEMGQDDNSQYAALAIYLASDALMNHANKDVRLLVACCVADVFRIFAPEAPYKDPDHLKHIFMFLIQQLRGLENPKDPVFKRYFYLLENLAWVKSFNICIELEDNQEIFCNLFKLMFTIVNDEHSSKVKNFMLDMMAPLISEADSVSQELLDLILLNIIEPHKSHNRNAYNLGKDLLTRTAGAVEPYIQAFFNNALILGKTSESEVSDHLFELIYELNSVSPSVLLAVLPQLEFKLKSNDEKERVDVTRLLARMFSDKDSDLAAQNKALWNCFLGRFNDISVSVRTRCVQYSMHFLINHPELTDDITEQLKLRRHDPEETVRYEVVMAIVSAAKKDFLAINDDLLGFVKERTLDKKFKIRKEALLGLAVIYKKCMLNQSLPKEMLQEIGWIKDKILHGYYQASLEDKRDRLLVERLLHTCLVPYQLEAPERMKKLYHLYATVDEPAIKAFNELLKCQHVIRNLVTNLLDLHKDHSGEREKLMNAKIAVLSKSLPEPVKVQEYLKKFNQLLTDDAKMRSQMEILLSPTCSCKKAEEVVRELLKKLGNPTQLNIFYTVIKQILERVAPVMIDEEALSYLMRYVDDSLRGLGEIDDEIKTGKGSERGLRLLLTLSYVFPGAFQNDECYGHLITFLKHHDELAADIAMQIFANVATEIEQTHPKIASCLIPLLQSMAKIGTPKQAKHAIRCIHVITEDSTSIYLQILEFVKKNLTLESANIHTALISIGHIGLLCPIECSSQLKLIVSKYIVKELIMQDKITAEPLCTPWIKDEQVSEETKAKILGMKLIVRWLLGKKCNDSGLGTSSLRLLSTIILHSGDLMENGKIIPAEMSRLRLAAGCSMLKLAHEPCYSEIVTLEQFQALALLINDECYQVREKFGQKLHKGLFNMKLPLEFLAVFALCGNEQSKELKLQMKNCLISNINKRREFLKQQPTSPNKMLAILPDYVLPYAIHLLAHDPDYKVYDNVKVLQQIKDCLWFILEPLMVKNENYSFSFFKKLIENIKQTKDAQGPENEDMNLKLYAVCDLALGLVMSKTPNFVLKDFPGEPVLPGRFFTNPDKTYSNTRTYLPKELAFTPPKVKTSSLANSTAAKAQINTQTKITSFTSNKSNPSNPSHSAVTIIMNHKNNAENTMRTQNKMQLNKEQEKRITDKVQQNIEPENTITLFDKLQQNKESENNITLTDNKVQQNSKSEKITLTDNKVQQIKDPPEMPTLPNIEQQVKEPVKLIDLIDKERKKALLDKGSTEKPPVEKKNLQDSKEIKEKENKAKTIVTPPPSKKPKPPSEKTLPKNSDPVNTSTVNNPKKNISAQSKDSSNNSNPPSPPSTRNTPNKSEASSNNSKNSLQMRPPITRKRQSKETSSSSKESENQPKSKLVKPQPESKTVPRPTRRNSSQVEEGKNTNTTSQKQWQSPRKGVKRKQELESKDQKSSSSDASQKKVSSNKRLNKKEEESSRKQYPMRRNNRRLSMTNGVDRSQTSDGESGATPESETSTISPPRKNDALVKAIEKASLGADELNVKRSSRKRR